MITPTARLLLGFWLFIPSFAGADGIGTNANIITKASGIMICKSSFVPRVLKFDAKSGTTKVFSAWLGSSTVEFIDIFTGEKLTLKENESMGYKCEEQP